MSDCKKMSPVLYATVTTNHATVARLTNEALTTNKFFSLSFLLLLLHKQRLNFNLIATKVSLSLSVCLSLDVCSNGGHNHGTATLQMSFDFFALCFTIVLCLDHFVASLNMFTSFFRVAEAAANAVLRSFWRQN